VTATVFQDPHFSRSSTVEQGREVIRDVHRERGAEIVFVRQSPDDRESWFTVAPMFEVERVAQVAIGSLLHGTDQGGRVTIWVPTPPHELRVDKRHRLERHPRLVPDTALRVDSQVRVKVSSAAGSQDPADFRYMRLADPDGAFFAELAVPSERERYTYRVSEWFLAASVGDVWSYLRHGSVYDPRSSKVDGVKFKCQQCAFAWWIYFQGLRERTGKVIYDILRDEVAYSVLLDMDSRGRWRHGFWSDDFETHARFQLDGIDLLLSQFDVTSVPKWLVAARRGMDYVLEHLTDPLDDGLPWFLHDTIEDRQNHRIRTEAYGKAPGNSLCLNTHMQALKVLFRLAERVSDGHGYRVAYEKGMQALQRVLANQPAGPLYDRLVAGILNDRVPEDRALVQRIRRRIMRRLRPALYWQIQRRYPRLVYGNGFIERDLSRSCVSDRYHVTNLKDMLKLYELKPEPWLKEYIVHGMAFLRKYVSGQGLPKLIGHSPYYIESMDIEVLYSELIDPIPEGELRRTESQIVAASGAYSLEAHMVGSLGKKAPSPTSADAAAGVPRS
jgi:hypothetical protein